MTPQKCLVAGLGNPLQGSDGFGAAVLECLRSRPDLPPSAELIDGGTDFLFCLDQFASYDLVVLIDAFLGPSPREVAVIDESGFAEWTAHSTTSHELSPLVAVRLYRALHPESDIRFVLVGLRVDPADFSRSIVLAEAQVGADAVLRVVSGNP